MNKFNESEISMIFNNSLNMNESMSNLKDSLRSEMKNVKSKNMIENYSQILDEHDKEKSMLIKTTKKNKVKSMRIRNVDYKSKTILEYSFVQDSEQYKESEEANNNNHTPCSNSHLKKYNSFYEKNMEEKIIRNQRLEELRNKKRLDELSEMKSSPGISENSKRFAFRKAMDDRPLHERYYDEVENKKLRLQYLKEYLKEGEESQIKPQRSKSFNEASFQDWVNINQTWEKKKVAKVDYLKKEIERENIDEDLSFNPKINKISDFIANNKKNLEDPNVSFYEKLHRKHEEKLKKIENKKVASIPSFTPQINRYPSYIKSKVHGNSLSKTIYFEERLESGESKSKSTTTATINTNKFVKSKGESKTNILLKSQSSNNLKGKNFDNKDKDSEKLYKLNVRSSSAWKKQVNLVKPYERSKEILNLSLKYWQ